MVKDFLSEVKGMMEMYNSYSIHIFTFDTAVYNPQTYTEDSGDDLINYDIQGGGGTDFEVCYNYMKDEGIEPKQFIMFTDGYPWGSWGDADYCDSLFVVHGNESIEAPFGVTAHYTFNKT
jgi:predicted metal-dependent peptidase